MIDFDGGLVLRIKADHDRLMSLLLATEPSLAIAMEATLSKTLLVSGASHVEFALQDIIEQYYRDVTGNNEMAVQFVRNKAISRQYHTYFQWDGSNANGFFGLFGHDFKLRAQGRIKADSELASAVANFLELGSLRNQMIHGNYASFTLAKTADEIAQLFAGAVRFLVMLEPLLREAD